jgi:hypothetical protein
LGFLEKVTKMNREKVEKIAQWWTDRIDDTEKYDNGNPQDAINLKEGIETLKTLGFKFKDTSVNAEQKENFRLYLVSLLMAKGDELRTIGVDYDPDEILDDVLYLAKIYINPLPIKTWVDEETMRGKIGYSGEWEDI